jgi:hypothetical protein
MINIDVDELEYNEHYNQNYEENLLNKAFKTLNISENINKPQEELKVTKSKKEEKEQPKEDSLKNNKLDGL